MLHVAKEFTKNLQKLTIFFNILFHKNVISFCENFRLSEICLIPYASAYVLRNLTQYKLSYNRKMTVIRTTVLFNGNYYYLVKILNNCQLLLKLKLPCYFDFSDTQFAHMLQRIWYIFTCDYVNFHCFLSLMLSLIFLLLLSLFIENEVSWVESLINKENT
jgi:hypothetical protein